MKQILLITDGCSNVGISPVVAAAQAKADNIIVNVIGVIDHGNIGEQGSVEIQEIARAGGGMSRIVSTSVLAQTVQMITRKTVVSTIQQVVQQELRQITGHAAIESLPPDQRGKVVQVIDEWSETVPIKVALLIDTSASMKPKLRAVEEAIRDLMLSLQARNGVSEIAVFHFPATRNGYSDTAELMVDWTKDLAKIPHMFYKLMMKGTTPTGPALLKVIHHMTADTSKLGISNDESLEIKDARHKNKDGILSDYVV